ncbi:MAG: sulfite exporter TauE/SafE family protein [Candidatus Nanopelagicales bacterium]|nr:sulfite exporter TauE/SafE family protein [Candidatus Nanopelagicales bacterium]
MMLADAVALSAAGLVAGALNAAVGSGTLITYPVLLTVGLPPVAANATNSLGMVPGSLSGAWMYRSNLKGRRQSLIKWSLATGAGAVVGATLVVLLPERVFVAVVPWLILSACLLIAVQPVLLKYLSKGSHRAVTPAIGAVGVYGGYFGAGQGIAYLAALGSLDGGDIHHANAAKNVVASAANGAAAATFALAGRVVWLPALVICIGTLVGGFAGGGIARRLPSWALRSVIVAVGVYAAVLSFSKG